MLSAHSRLVDLSGRRIAGYLSVMRDMLRILNAEGMVHADECALLMQLAARVHEGVIVELGSYRGRSTVALALGSKRGARVPVHAVEPHARFTGVLGAEFGPEDRLAFERNIARSGADDLVQHIARHSEKAVEGWSQPIGLLWIDADHAYEAVRRDFSLWTRHLTPGGVVALDDSTVPGIGPYRVVQESLASGRYAVADAAGKITVLVRRAAD